MNNIDQMMNNLKTISDNKVISEEVLFENNFIRVRNYRYTKWKSDKEHQYYSIQRLRPVNKTRVEVEKIVTTFVVTEDEKVILTNQYRFPQKKFCIENPAGLQDKENETLEETARREIFEETWYEPEQMIYLGKTPTSSGLTSEVIDCFIWVNSKKVTDILHLDNAEDIQVLEIPLALLDEFIEKVKDRVDLIIDYKVRYMLGEYRKMKENWLISQK